jgi:lipoprotein NlpD
MFATAGCGSRVLPPVTDKTTQEAPVQVLGRSLTGSYRVKPGDTVYSIAFEAGADYRDLAAWNGIETPYRIRSGQVLRLSAPAPAATPATAPPRAPAPRAVEPETKIKWSWPADGAIVQGFGGAHAGRGLVFGGREGQSVRTAAAGKVVYAGSGLRGYGELIIVKHDETYLSAYAHNRKLLVQEGHTVSAGQTIAEMGDGGAPQVRLHFEIRRRGVPVDPMAYLPRR